MDPIKFQLWLQKQGAEVLPITNSYEVARFIAGGRTNVVYQGRRGITALGFAQECVRAYEAGRGINMGFKQKPRPFLLKRKFVLLERDGPCCFFCHLLMGEDMTIEHLVGRGKGGPDHQDNLALAHKLCNEKAANLPLMQKIKLRENLKPKA